MGESSRHVGEEPPDIPLLATPLPRSHITLGRSFVRVEVNDTEDGQRKESVDF